MSRRLAFILSMMFAAIASSSWADTPPVPGAPIKPTTEAFEMKVIASGLGHPHNMVLGPDGQLWLTELSALRIVRVDPATGKLGVLANVTEAVHSKDETGDDKQDGLLGIALHPDLLKGKGRDYVYVSLAYTSGQGGEFPNRTAIRRYTYDAKSGKLVAPLDILKGLPSAHDHQSARLLFGPDGKLYYSIGDQGANQIEYLCRANEAQVLPTADEVKAGDWQHYKGKVLRLNVDGSIPADNPLIHGVRSHIYAWGIRNTQGMVFSPAGKLFATDQGPNADDELNLLLPGRNYGWPNVAGRKDDAGYAYANFSAAQGGCAGLKDPGRNGLQVPPGVPVAKESSWSDPDFVEPLKTFFTVGNDYDYTNPVCKDNDLYFICWPTVAPSSVTYYKGGRAGVPGWAHSLLITSLKRGLVFRVQLDPTDSVPVGDAQPMLRTQNRYREIVVSADGSTLYVATDPGHLGTTNAGNAAFKLENPGSILAFKYSAAK